jgi:hypothetical protein
VSVATLSGVPPDNCEGNGSDIDRWCMEAVLTRALGSGPSDESKLRMDKVELNLLATAKISKC